jgi:formylglycine-generating enzyme required for sulfatase activity
MQSNGKKIAILAGCVAVGVIAGVAWYSGAHIRFWWEFEPLGKNEQGYREYRHRQTGIVFVKLPGGTFNMGSSKEDGEKAFDDFSGEYGGFYKRAFVKWIADEQPGHEVTLSSFIIAKHEVTQAEWLKVMGENPSNFKGENLPVEQVSWEDCQEFCEKTGFKLPTEAEWEYACRAGKEGAYAGTGKLAEMGWNGRKCGGITHPVGEKEPNDFGIYDMHGNVWEWCEDVFDEDFYSKPEATKKNPVCTSGSEARVSRGGGWVYDAWHCRSASRSGSHPSNSSELVGFRPSRSSLP